MNTPEEPPRTENSSDSSAGIVGTGVSIAAVGVLFLLLGWAQSMRQVASAAMILLIIGAVLLVGGCVLAGMGKARKSR